MAGHLDREVGRRPEPEEPQATAGLDAAQPQRPVADDAGAQERRRLDVAHPVGQGEGEVSPGCDSLGVPTVDRPPTEVGQLAQVLAAREALTAPAAGAGQPRQADPLTGAHDPPDDLVARDHRPLAHLDVAGDDLKVGAAHATRRHLDDHLARTGDGLFDVAEREVVRRREDHRLHGRIVRRGREE